MPFPLARPLPVTPTGLCAPSSKTKTSWPEEVQETERSCSSQDWALAVLCPAWVSTETGLSPSEVPVAEGLAMDLREQNSLRELFLRG